MPKEIISNQTYINLKPGCFPIENPATLMPGRRDLRISVTSRCNFRCEHCHNEGQPPPWAERDPSDRLDMTVDTISQLVTTAQHFGVKTVKLTGGDFGMYRHMEDLLSNMAGKWQEKMQGISWGINTNGTPLLNPKTMALIVDSPIHKVTFGIDSLLDKEKSKPVSSTGVASRKLFNSVVLPLSDAWNGQQRNITIDTVYTGNEPRILSVIEGALNNDLGVKVLEVNGVMGTKYDTRQRYLDFMGKIAETFDLDPKYYEPLNQIYLYDKKEANPDKTKVKFFQDHCADLDCGNCRKIHVRVVSKGEHTCAVPCFLQGQGSYIPLDSQGKIDSNLFKNALPKLSTGPDWKQHGRA